jgi:hypothetical protein
MDGALQHYKHALATASFPRAQPERLPYYRHKFGAAGAAFRWAVQRTNATCPVRIE